jgi:hypothetical protein
MLMWSLSEDAMDEHVQQSSTITVITSSLFFSQVTAEGHLDLHY